jgi:hypothetical protein
MTSVEMIVAVGAVFGIELAPDAEGRAAFSSPDGLHVEMHADPHADEGSLCAMVGLGSLRERSNAALALHLLRANARSSGPGLPFFSLTPDGEVVLNTVLLAPMPGVDEAVEAIDTLLERAAADRGDIGAEALQFA